jgi:hypothetical protein
MALKMTPEHQARIQEAIKPLDTPANRAGYVASNLSDLRYHWDLLRAAGLIPFVCSELYPYLNDDHIGSAMRHLVQPLSQEAPCSDCKTPTLSS